LGYISGMRPEVVPLSVDTGASPLSLSVDSEVPSVYKIVGIFNNLVFDSFNDKFLADEIEVILAKATSIVTVAHRILSQIEKLKPDLPTSDEKETGEGMVQMLHELIERETFDSVVETSRWVAHYATMALLDCANLKDLKDDSTTLLNSSSTNSGEQITRQLIVTKCRDLLVASLNMSARVSENVSKPTLETIAILDGSALSCLGTILRLQEDPVASEGLFRNSLNKFITHKEYALRTISGKAAYAELLFQYSSLLECWEGREHEAADLLSQGKNIALDLTPNQMVSTSSILPVPFPPDIQLRARYRLPTMSLSRCFFFS